MLLLAETNRSPFGGCHAKPSNWFAFCAAGLVACALAVVGCADDPPPTDANPPKPEKPDEIVALGQLEPAGGVIAISAMPGDRLKQLDPDVAVNQRAPANGVLGVLGSYETRKAQLDALQVKRNLATQQRELDLLMAEAKLREAEAALAQTTAKQQEVEQQSKRLSYLQEATAIARDDYQRLVELTAEDPDLVTSQQLRRQENQVDQAEKDYEIARGSYEAGIAAAKSAYSAAVASREAAARSLAKMREIDSVVAVDEEIKAARQQLADSVLWTPDVDLSEVDATEIKLVEGDPPGVYTVLKTHVRPGEFVSQMPIMQVGDLNEIVCVAEVYEADAKFLAVDEPAVIKSQAFRGNYQESGIAGTIQTISRVVSNPGLVARNPLAPVDRSVVEVRVKINDQDPAALEEASHWIGLQVTVNFPLGTNGSQASADEAAGDASPGAAGK